jgi:hypothetical protein
MLVIERYSVHEITVDPYLKQASSKRSLSVHQCLASFPEFHARGLASATIDCQENQCQVVLLSLDGASALLCPMQSGDLEYHPDLITLDSGKGGKGWRSIVSTQADSRKWYALSRDATHAKSIYSLSVGSRLRTRAVGQSESRIKGKFTQFKISAKPQSLAASANYMFGLLQSGRVNVWHAKNNGELSLSGLLRLPGTTNWTSICAVDEDLYALTSASPDGAPELWHFPLSKTQTSFSSSIGLVSE